MKINSVSNLSLMCARINNLNQFNSKESTINKTELMSKDVALAFRSQSLTGCRRPVINNVESKLVFDKIAQILKNSRKEE